HLNTEPIWENYSNFALADDSIVFYFDEYALAAGAVGPPIVAIPLHAINNLLAEEFKLQEQQSNPQPDNDSEVEKPDDSTTPNVNEQPVKEDNASNTDTNTGGTPLPDGTGETIVKKV